MIVQVDPQADFALTIFQALLASIPLWLGVAEYIGNNLSKISERLWIQSIIADLFVLAYGVLLVAIGILTEFLTQRTELADPITSSIHYIDLFLLLTGAIVLAIFRLNIGKFDKRISLGRAKLNVGRQISESTVGVYLIVAAVFLWSVGIIESVYLALGLGILVLFLYYIIDFGQYLTSSNSSETVSDTEDREETEPESLEE